MKRNIDPAKIRGLAIDLDGTMLLPGGILGNRTRDCLKKLISMGMQVIISTGRAIESSEKYRSEIGAEGPMVFFNGAEIADVPSGKILYANLIGMDVVDFGTDIARKLGIHYQVYLPAGISPDTGLEDPKKTWESLLIDKDDPEADNYYKHTGISPLIKDLKAVVAFPINGCIKSMFIADPSCHDEIRRLLNERFGNKINVTRSFPTFLEILNAGVSKGEGLKIVMKHRGLKPEEVIAFGDEENDLPMFTAAGYACAPMNARENVKEAADFIYGANTEEGIAEYLEKMFIN
ncbi:MAG: Cof-type HAD-IIB family hydrolase [Treponema sp.]|nr:Cof-type HAD-IIB family hydrolase [Treponema sp.]